MQSHKPMNHFFHALRWDLVHLQRNQLIVLAALMAAVYLGIFYLLRPLGNLDRVLIILVFNDPVVTGFLFGGLFYLFDLDQQTLPLLRILPVRPALLLLSKSVALTLLALATAVVMVLVAHGPLLQWGHFLPGTALSSLFFIYCGFALAARTRNFSSFLFSSIGFLVLMAAPFLSLFEIAPEWPLRWIPSAAGLVLLRAAFEPVGAIDLLYAYFYLSVATVVGFRLALREMNRQAH